MQVNVHFVNWEYTSPMCKLNLINIDASKLIFCLVAAILMWKCSLKIKNDKFFLLFKVTKKHKSQNTLTSAGKWCTEIIYSNKLRNNFNLTENRFLNKDHKTSISAIFKNWLNILKLLVTNAILPQLD